MVLGVFQRRLKPFLNTRAMTSSQLAALAAEPRVNNIRRVLPFRASEYPTPKQRNLLRGMEISHRSSDPHLKDHFVLLGLVCLAALHFVFLKGVAFLTWGPGGPILVGKP